MAEIALAAVRPLLQLVHHEAQLLRGVRGDVQFISDEMESMKGFLLNLAGTKEGAGNDYQVRAWMAQVMELAYVSTNCIKDYTLSGRARSHDWQGLVGWLQRLARQPKCLLARRRVATRIKKLKVRVLEVSERQQRYAVAVPPKKDAGGDLVVDWKLQVGRVGGRGPEWFTHPDRDAPRRAILTGPDILTEGTEEVIRWLKEQPGEEELQWPRVVAILSPDGNDEATALADQAYKKMCSDAELSFDLTARVTIIRPTILLEVLLDMRRQLLPEDFFQSMGKETDASGMPQLRPMNLPPPLKGKKLLVVISGLEYPEEWAKIKADLHSFECSSGSAIVLSTKVKAVVNQCSPRRTRVHSLVDFHLQKAVILAPASTTLRVKENDRRIATMENILKRCSPNVYCMSLFLQALYRNPYRTVKELKNLYESLDPQRSSKIDMINQMMRFCYHGLPQAYKNCLWYATIFARRSYKIKRASLMRRWVAEHLIDKKDRWSALDEAERCFDALSFHGLLIPNDVDGAGKVKSCAVHPLVTSILKETMTDEDFLDPNQLPPALALHFSIRNGIYLRQLSSMKHSMISPQKNTKVDWQMNSMMKFLKSLTSSSSFRLLRVLDLEGYKGFKKRHLKNICKIHQLRYLSLRNTDVAQLPKEADQLVHLETLDIRGTSVLVFNAVLPMLKHLLAGRIKSASQGESFFTVRWHPDVAVLEHLEILSHIRVSNSAKELIEAGEKLQKLRKLGLVLSGKKASLENLFREVSKFNRCLSSLSIRVEPRLNRDTADAAVLTLPNSLESLRICGITGWSPSWIKELHHLAKITLCETFLKGDALSTLGALRGLLCLRLRYHAFAEVILIFEAGKFQSLMDLVIEDDNIKSITFASGTAQKLGRMVWSFKHMDSLSGAKDLLSLRCLELNGGGCNSDGLNNLRQDIPKRVRFSLNTPEDGQGSGATAAAAAGR